MPEGDPAGYESPTDVGIEIPGQAIGMGPARAEAAARARAEIEARNAELSLEIERTADARRLIVLDARRFAKFNSGRITYLVNREIGANQFFSKRG